MSSVHPCKVLQRDFTVLSVPLPHALPVDLSFLFFLSLILRFYVSVKLLKPKTCFVLLPPTHSAFVPRGPQQGRDKPAEHSTGLPGFGNGNWCDKQ